MRGRLLHKFAIGLIVFAMVMLCSCENRQLQERFDTVERIAADYPDSAIGLLKEVKDTKFSKSEQARYDLLLAEARYMSGENDTIAGRLTDIAEYYDRKGDKHNAARAYYYEGIIYANNHKPLKSIISHLKVLNTKIGDPILRGRAYRAIAENYEVLMDYESALRYYELSYHAFTEAPNNKYTDYSIMDISRAYFAVAKYDSSLCYAEEVLANATRDHNESLHASALCQPIQLP
jgi:tetratricopeptide (TPR) repeat protein